MQRNGRSTQRLQELPQLDSFFSTSTGAKRGSWCTRKPCVDAPTCQQRRLEQQLHLLLGLPAASQVFIWSDCKVWNAVVGSQRMQLHLILGLPAQRNEPSSSEKEQSGMRHCSSRTRPIRSRHVSAAQPRMQAPTVAQGQHTGKPAAHRPFPAPPCRSGAEVVPSKRRQLQDQPSTNRLPD